MKYVTDMLIWTPELMITGWFIAYILTHEVNMSFRIKKAIGIPPTEYMKLLDCAPCITWWTTLIFTFEPVTSASAYLISTLIDKLES